MKQYFRRLWYTAIVMVGTTALIESSAIAQQATRQHQAQPVPQVTAPSIIADSREITALAAHLKKVGAKMYGAYWCPHCAHQKEMFGEAFRDINYVECDPRGENPRPKLCKEAGVKGYPTWEINGKSLVGVQSLEELAKASNYRGVQKF